MRSLLLLLQKEQEIDRDLPSQLLIDYMKYVNKEVVVDTPSAVDNDRDTTTYYSSDIDLVISGIGNLNALVVETNGNSVLISYHSGSVNYQRAFALKDNVPFDQHTLEIAIMVITMGVNLNLPFNKMEWVFSNSLQGFIV